MTDKNNTPESPAQTNKAAGSEADAARPVFNLQRVYLKDCSLEAPHAPHIFLENQEPRLEFQLDTAEQELGNNLVEVLIRCTVTCRFGDRVGFLAEAKEAAIFEIANVSDEQRALLKGITCPTIVYPYLRANLSDLIQRSSFPPFHLAEINWEAFYQQKQAQKAESDAARQ
ncbi:MAG: protein-export chaperone SecB [Burkholderiaceae bacterium]